jgi:hypothetical protein
MTLMATAKAPEMECTVFHYGPEPKYTPVNGRGGEGSHEQHPRPSSDAEDGAVLETARGPRIPRAQEGQGGVGDRMSATPMELIIEKDLANLKSRSVEESPALTRMQHAKQILNTAKDKHTKSHRGPDASIDANKAEDKSWMRVRAEPVIKKRRPILSRIFGGDGAIGHEPELDRQKVPD